MDSVEIFVGDCFFISLIFLIKIFLRLSSSMLKYKAYF